MYLWLSICLYVCLSVYLYVYLSVCLCMFLSVCLSVCMCVCVCASYSHTTAYHPKPIQPLIYLYWQNCIGIYMLQMLKHVETSPSLGPNTLYCQLRIILGRRESQVWMLCFWCLINQDTLDNYMGVLWFSHFLRVWH